MPTTTAQVAEAFEKTGNGWILTDSQRDRILAAVAQEIDKFVADYARRFHVTPEPFRLLEDNPPKAAAFFQSFVGPPHSVDVRLLIWHLLAGADIASVRFSYERGGESSIIVRTETPYGESAEFTSNNVWDFSLFRHIGLLGMDDVATLAGYYALRRP